jgi:hypothetical protein
LSSRTASRKTTARRDLIETNALRAGNIDI